MASSSNTSNPLFGIHITEKLNKNNHALWQPQVLAAIRGARMEGHISGKTKAPDAEVDEKGPDGKTIKVPNPAYEEWFARDQQILGFILSSVLKEVFIQIAASQTAAQAWQGVADTSAAQRRARSVNVRLALSTTQKGAASITEYFTKMRSLGDEMAAAGKPLDDEEMTAYILNGLDIDYESIVSAVLNRENPISLTDIYSQLLSFESRVELKGASGYSANVAHRGG